jgi:hypothetical protein
MEEGLTVLDTVIKLQSVKSHSVSPDALRFHQSDFLIDVPHAATSVLERLCFVARCTNFPSG